MNATQPAVLHPPRRSPRPQSAPQEGLKPKHRAIALEAAVKLVVNVAVSGLAATALIHLLPYHQSGETKLQKLETEVQATEIRVNRLRETFSRSFDPKQTKNIMQEESNLTDPTHMRVIFKESQPEPK
jgi:hypothetical protein